MQAYLTSMRKELLDGKGFILFKGFPVERWGNHKSAVAYMGLGTYLGYFVSQNGLGHVLGHVKVCFCSNRVQGNVSARDEVHVLIHVGHWCGSDTNRQSPHLPHNGSAVLPHR